MGIRIESTTCDKCSKTGPHKLADDGTLLCPNPRKQTDSEDIWLGRLWIAAIVFFFVLLFALPVFKHYYCKWSDYWNPPVVSVESDHG